MLPCTSTRGTLAIYLSIFLELSLIILAILLHEHLLIIPVVVFPVFMTVVGTVLAWRNNCWREAEEEEENAGEVDVEAAAVASSASLSSIDGPKNPGIGIDGNGLVVDMDYTKSLSTPGDHEASTKILRTLNGFSARVRIRFSYQELVEATNKFARRIPDYSAYGLAYEGIHHLTGQRLVVVKVEVPGAQEALEKHFHSELSAASANHRCMVQLLGFCHDGKHRFLVYEHMANGSLSRWIFGQEGLLLAWSKRLKLAIDIARGLTYLHEWCEDRIVQFDIDLSNIQLDENFHPKFANFGATLKRLHPKHRPHRSTSFRSNSSKRVGGQIAPSKQDHTAPDAVVTQKSDVFSYGVMLLELVSGQSSQDDSSPTDQQQVRRTSSAARHEFAQDCMTKFRTKREEADEPTTASVHGIELFVDSRLGGNFNESEAVRMVQVGMWCIQTDPAMRPTMAMVTQMLRGDFDVNNSLPKSLNDFIIVTSGET